MIKLNKNKIENDSNWIGVQQTNSFYGRPSDDNSQMSDQQAMGSLPLEWREGQMRNIVILNLFKIDCLCKFFGNFYITLWTASLSDSANHTCKRA